MLTPWLAYDFEGLFTPEALTVALVAGPAYGFGMLTGPRLFYLASDETFRRIAIAIVAVVALMSLPVFDGLYR